MKTGEIFITHHDMARLRALIEVYGGTDSPHIDRLKVELDRARIVDPRDIPVDVVTMNSVVRIKDLETGEEKTFALVFPDKTGAAGKAVSVLAPVGTALIGCREGDTMEWTLPTGTMKIQITEIIYQPERIGNYDL
jgi:regulator of nucleoside diphosphate kinase